ncbi:hypothetical protein J4Q44_G00192780 [Coregonus suidteri]|uniref:Uncharacterized protein n=1 Tax=Coregonus suidteri TaxID=861788 RepID=A0AAN8QUE7_9TELE
MCLTSTVIWNFTGSLLRSRKYSGKRLLVTSIGRSLRRGHILQYNFDVTKGNIYVRCMEGGQNQHVLRRPGQEREG